MPRTHSRYPLEYRRRIVELARELDPSEPNAAIASVYVGKAAFEGRSAPERIVLTVQEA